MRKEILLSAVILSLLSLAMPTFADEVSVIADVEKYVEVTPNFASVSYGPLATGSTDTAGPNQLDGVYNFTVDANFGYIVSVSGTNFTDGGSNNFLKRLTNRKSILTSHTQGSLKKKRLCCSKEVRGSMELMTSLRIWRAGGINFTLGSS